MKTKDRFDENGWLKDEFLWPLRQQITLGSIYVADYNNTFGIAPEKVCEFFTSFWDSYCEELAKEDHVWDKAIAEVQRLAAEDSKIADKFAKNPSAIESYQQEYYLDIFQKLYDNEETLKSWYACFDRDSNPLPPKMVNVDIHWDFARSIQVIAGGEDEAEEIVDEMMRNGEIPQSSFEATGDWELDTEWQPE